jgi:hypothetical protein
LLEIPFHRCVRGKRKREMLSPASFTCKTSTTSHIRRRESSASSQRRLPRRVPVKFRNPNHAPSTSLRHSRATLSIGERGESPSARRRAWESKAGSTVRVGRTLRGGRTDNSRCRQPDGRPSAFRVAKRRQIKQKRRERERERERFAWRESAKLIRS